MLLELGNIFENEGGSIPFDLVIKTDGSDIAADPCFLSGIHAVGEIKNNAGIVRLIGQADFDYQAPCDRCAVLTEKHFSIPLEHELVRRLYSDKQDDDFLLVEGGEFDFGSICYEDAIFSLPTRYLCKEDCKGLCPNCGADLNAGNCGCKKPSDPRLEALKMLLDN